MFKHRIDSIFNFTGKGISYYNLKALDELKLRPQIGDHYKIYNYSTHVEIIKTLIEHKANLNHIFNGKTALQQCNEHLEARRKSKDVVGMNDIATIISLLKANGAR